MKPKALHLHLHLQKKSSPAQILDCVCHSTEGGNREKEYSSNMVHHSLLLKYFSSCFFKICVFVKYLKLERGNCGGGYFSIATSSGQQESWFFCFSALGRCLCWVCLWICKLIMTIYIYNYHPLNQWRNTGLNEEIN